MNFYNQTDELFNDGLAKATITPPGDAWNNISAQLERTKRRKIYMLGQIAAGITVLVTAAIIFMQVNKNNQNHTNSNNKLALDATVNTLPDNTLNKQANPISSDNNTLATNGSMPAQKIIKKHTTPGQKKILPPSPPAPEGKAVQKNDITPTTYTNNAQEQLNTTIYAAVSNTYFTDNKQVNQVSNKILQEQDNLIPDNNNVAANKKKFKISVRGQVSPLITNADSRATTADMLSTNTNGTPEQQVPSITFSGGMKLNIQRGKRISIQTGLYYSKLGHYSESGYIEHTPTFSGDINTETPDVIHDQNGPVASAPPKPAGFRNITDNQIQQSTANNNLSTLFTTVESSETVELIEIPLEFNYLLIDDKMDLALLGGMAANVMVGQTSTTTITENSSFTEYSGADNNVRFSSQIGLGIHYPIWNKVNLVIEPTFKYYFSKIEVLENTTLKQLSFGLFTGINLQL